MSRRLKLLDTIDGSLYDIHETNDKLVVKYSQFGEWTHRVRGKKAMSVTNIDGGVLVKAKGVEVELDYSQIWLLRQLLDLAIGEQEDGILLEVVNDRK